MNEEQRESAPEEYWLKLKQEFTTSPKHEGYDADEDLGYFLEWLVERLWVAERQATSKQSS